MYRLLCKEEDITRGQRFLMDVIDRRELAQLCRETGLSFNYTYQIGIGGQAPPVPLIYTLRRYVHPVLWFYTEQEREPELRSYKNLTKEWEFRETIGFRELSSRSSLRKWCTDHHLQYTSLWFIASGKRPPSYYKIKLMRELIYPGDWLYTEEEAGDKHS